MNSIDAYLLVARAKTQDKTVTKPPHLRSKLKGVTLKQDGDGKYYVMTHRARSTCYDSPGAIPDKEVSRISETG